MAVQERGSATQLILAVKVLAGRVFLLYADGWLDNALKVNNGLSSTEFLDSGAASLRFSGFLCVMFVYESDLRFSWWLNEHNTLKIEFVDLC